MTGTHALAWRVTVGDADVVIEPGEANLRRLQEALAGLAVRPQTVSAVDGDRAAVGCRSAGGSVAGGGGPGCAPVITMLPTAGVVDSVIAKGMAKVSDPVALIKSEAPRALGFLTDRGHCVPGGVGPSPDRESDTLLHLPVSQ
jgi:hypothetical protein